MEQPIIVSTPSRLCLFGEHQDYLGLEVVALAINLRFHAQIVKRKDSLVRIRIRDERLGQLGVVNDNNLYECIEIDLSQPIVYRHKRDYMRSSVNLLRKEGIVGSTGYDILMDSEIPIGKGMCSSTAMIMVLLRAIMEAEGYTRGRDPDYLARMGFRAEVVEFGEPGGMMDHYTSAFGNLVHIDFSDGVNPIPIDTHLPGRFVLFDSLAGKDTLRVLHEAKAPVVSALESLLPHGIHSVRDFYADPDKLELLDTLDDVRRRKLMASIDNYAILREAVWMLRSGKFDAQRFGSMLTRHHENLRDGLNISTPVIEKILDTAIKNGALGGKINGSGGGGCCFVYCRKEQAQAVKESVEALGYPGMILKADSGIRREGIE